jgi:hypothetical protein
VVRADFVDSMRVRVTFDDYFDVDEPVLGATAEIHQLPDSVRVAAARRLLLAPVYERGRVAAEAAAAQRAAAAAADTAAAVRADTVAPPAAPAPRPETPLLPAREIVVELDRALPPGHSFTITVAGAINISGLAGGGVARFDTPPAAPPPDPPPPDPPPPDPPPPDPPPPDPGR